MHNALGLVFNLKKKSWQTVQEAIGAGRDKEERVSEMEFVVIGSTSCNFLCDQGLLNPGHVYVTCI